MFAGNSISSMGVSAPPPGGSTAVPASQPSPRVYQERVHVSVNTLPEFNSVSDLSLSQYVSPYAAFATLGEAKEHFDSASDADH